MAIDKVVDSAQLDAAMTATANAIRTQGGTTAQIQWKQSNGFADAIAAISTSKLEILVTVTSGATVTATKGSQSVSGTSVNGQCKLTVPEAGAWTVTAVLNGRPAVPREVAVGDSYPVDMIFASPTLNDNEWSVIRAASDADLARSLWSVGDCKAITLNGSFAEIALSNYTCYAFILGFNHNAALEGNNRIHFQIGKTALTDGEPIAFVDNLYGNEVPSDQFFFSMNNTATNYLGWEGSQMRTSICGTDIDGKDGINFLSVLPAELLAVLKYVTKYTDNAGDGTNLASNVTSTADCIFLLSEFERYGRTDGRANPAEYDKQAQYSYFAAGNSNTYDRHDTPGSAAYAWTRSLGATDTDTFVFIYMTGMSFRQSANISSGFSPCFCV